MPPPERLEPDRFGPLESYSSRPRPETSRDVIANRVGMTSALFSVAVSLAYLLGRPHS